MATRKQERRERKRRTHGFEPGEVSRPVTEKPAGRADQGRKPRARTFGTVTMLPDGTMVMGRRRVSPPTWQRAGKRALLFLPIGLVFVLLIAKQRDPFTIVAWVTIYTLAAVPITLITDRFAYNRLLRKFEDAGGTVAAPPR